MLSAFDSTDQRDAQVACSSSSKEAHEFNDNMVRFYLEKDVTEMMAFLINCHPDAEHIQKTTPRE